MAGGMKRAMLDGVHTDVPIPAPLKNDLGIRNGNQANRHARISRHVGIGNGIICGTVGSSSKSWGPDHAAVGIARLMEVALKLIHELAPFLSHTDLGLLALTPLGIHGHPIENQ